jgi:hypothetical protein
VRFLVAGFAALQLADETLALVLGVVELREPVRDLAAGRVQLEAIDETPIGVVRARERRDLDGKTRE